MRVTLMAMMAAVSACGACRGAQQDAAETSLREELCALVDTVPGTVGIAYVGDDDTVTVNNDVNYAMMSVFKLHQALAVAATVGLDSLISVSSDELDRNTWSPMLEEYPEGDFSLPVSKLMKYAVTMSDNNASNLMFRHIMSPGETDAFVRSVAADTTFQILYSESEMKADPALSYLNRTSPLSAARLIRQVFELELVSAGNQDSIRGYLTAVTTGHDRLGAAVQDSADIALFGHKTGSGYRNANGELMAHNDVGYFRFTDGRAYSLAVFIRDFKGSEAEASAVIANISKCVYNHVR